MYAINLFKNNNFQVRFWMNAKTKKELILSLLIFTFMSNYSYANGSVPLPAAIREEAEIDFTKKDVNLEIKEENKLKINVKEPVKKIEGQAFNSKQEMMDQLFQAQKEMDTEDIQILWNSTVDRNPVIKFALKKLAVPPEQRKFQSSLMAKSVSALISGASLLPGLLGADSVTSSAASAGGTLAKRAIASKQMPKSLPLTDTELIHLARLVEDLQDRIIKNYYEYKNDLEALKIAHQEVIKQNIAYSVAIRANDSLSLMTTKVLYDNALKDEMNLRRDVKMHRLELERLAGSNTLNSLKLGKLLLDEKNKNSLASIPNVKDKNEKTCVNMSIRDLAQETNSELQDEMKDMLSDLNILWNAAVERSETIRFAILKLSNPDGKIDKTSSVKRILSPLAGAASVIGLGTGDPITATSAIFSGNFLNSFLSEDNARLNSQLSRVTDTDLVLLAQETDNLQQKLVNLYCNYTGSLAELDFADKIVENRRQHFESAQKISSSYKNIADVFYKEAIANQYKARQNVLSSRLALEQFVGNEALLSIDKSIKKRLSLK